MIKPAHYTTKILERSWLSQGTFELTCDRPEAFSFTPGQKIQIEGGDISREYSIASAPADNYLQLCIRNVEGGRVSAALSEVSTGSDFHFRGPYGYFNFSPADRPPVFVATGTGIAPFVSMARSGVKDFILFHGVRQIADLYYKSEMQTAARRYLPIISGAPDLPKGYFAGRVTDFLVKELPQTPYDFYLCGSGAMVRDAIMLVDEHFEGSRVFAEKFY